MLHRSSLLCSALLALVLGLGASSLAPTVASAQIADASLNRAAFYRFAAPNDVVVAVSVWGDVRYPGYYEVPRGTTLSALLSMAGGPANSRRTNRQRVRTQIALNRPRSESTDALEQIYVSEATNDIPALDQQLVLQGGDILSVETVTRTTFSWRDIFPIVGAIGSVVLIVDRLAR